MRLYVILLLLLVGCAQQADPIKVSLVTPTTGVIFLEANASCSASGGVPPYEYMWLVDGRGQECDTSCMISLGIGEHLVNCTVRDSVGMMNSDSADILVQRQQVDITDIYVVGDSLSYGKTLDDPEHENWAYVLAQEYDATLHNYAENGATSGDALEMQLEKVPDTTGQLVFLWIGSNDVIKYVPQPTFKNNYGTLVDSIKGDNYFVLINLPDASQLPIATSVEIQVNELIRALGLQIDGKQMVRNLIGSYNREIGEIAEENNLPLIDMFGHMENFDDSYVSSDNFHPNKEGQAAIESSIREDLKEKYPELEFY